MIEKAFNQLSSLTFEYLVFFSAELFSSPILNGNDVISGVGKDVTEFPPDRFKCEDIRLD